VDILVLVVEPEHLMPTASYSGKDRGLYIRIQEPEGPISTEPVDGRMDVLLDRDASGLVVGIDVMLTEPLSVRP
jgi:uncharacterized protein YuzE